MMNFRIFCELLAKMMRGTIDFTMVFRGYRRNGKPEILGIATLSTMYLLIHFLLRRNGKPEILGIATRLTSNICFKHFHSRNEKPETLGIATPIRFILSE